jgi:hypothetical protein
VIAVGFDAVAVLEDIGFSVVGSFGLAADVLAATVDLESVGMAVNLDLVADVVRVGFAAVVIAVDIAAVVNPVGF